MSNDEHWKPFDGFPDEPEERPSAAWVRQLNAALSLVDSKWADWAEGKGNEPPLQLAAVSVGLIQNALARLKGIDAEMDPLQELFIALSNAINGKRDDLLQPLDGHREPGFGVRMLRGRAVLAVELLMDDGLAETEALKLVARQLGLRRIPALSVKWGTIRDWRSNVRNGSMPKEAAHYEAAKNDLKTAEKALASAGFEAFRLNRKQLFRALFDEVAKNECIFGV